MKKSDLIARLSQRFPGLSATDMRVSVELILQGIAEALSAGQRVEVRGFGSFDLAYRRPRLGRNPRTGEPVSIPAKASPHFKAGKNLRQRVAIEANQPHPRKKYRLDELMAQIPHGTPVGREIL
ncbi:MAG: integration host factor subunit beta [Rhodocyclales bacterium]|nr:integration host factor subunit beta [Rhodocyclales bacterium]